MARRAMAFMVEEPACYSLMFHRIMPGFMRSPEVCALSREVIERAREWFARDGGGDSGALDLVTSLMGWPAGRSSATPRRQLVRLANTAADMFLACIKARGRNTARRSRERT